MTTLKKCLSLGIAILTLTLPTRAVGKPGSEIEDGRAEISGSQGPIRWESLLQGDGLAGWEIEDSPWTPTAWSREDDTLIADVGDGNRARIVQGDDSWRSYELSVQATLVKGGSFQLWFAIHDGKGHHFATLTGWQAAALIEPDHTKLDVADFV